MKPCDIEFYEEVIKGNQKVRVHLRGPKEPVEGVIVKESERAIIFLVTDGRTKQTKRRLIYKGAIMEVEEL